MPARRTADMSSAAIFARNAGPTSCSKATGCPDSVISRSDASRTKVSRIQPLAFGRKQYTHGLSCRRSPNTMHRGWLPLRKHQRSPISQGRPTARTLKNVAISEHYVAFVSITPVIKSKLEKRSSGAVRLNGTVSHCSGYATRIGNLRLGRPSETQIVAIRSEFGGLTSPMRQALT